MKVLTLLGTAALVMAVPGGCSEAPEETSGPATDAEVEAAAAVERADSGFAEPQALLDHLKAMNAPEDRFELLDLTYPRTMAEKHTIEQWRKRDLSRQEFEELLREQFADETADDPVHDYDMGEFTTMIADATVERTEGRRAYATYAGPEEDDEREVVLVRYRDSWWVAPETLTGGTIIDDFWFAERQGYFQTIPGAVAACVEKLRQGEFGSAEEARAALEEILQSPGGTTGLAPPRLPVRKR